MTTVYVVTDGDYSDYRIEAVFSTQEKAEAYIARRGEHSEWFGGRVEQYDLDNMDTDWLAGRVKCWDVWMKVESADVYKVDLHDGDPQNDMEMPRLYEGQVNFCICVLADTQERAVKVAMERRSVWLANGGAHVWNS